MNMSEELINDMQQVAADQLADPRARKLATEALELLQQRIVPSPKKLALIAKLTMPVGDCARLERDMTCVWLRKHGEGYDLPVPPIGLRAHCMFRGNFTKCPGFRRIGPR